MSPVEEVHKDYIPALHFSRLTVFYDVLMRLTMREATFKGRLITYASVADGYRVLDLGCGTATLTLMVKQRYPVADVIGLDIDRDSLALATHKIHRINLAITLMQGTAFRLPFTGESFDCVLSNLVYHHLTRENKIESMRDVLRILKPGGEFLLADFGKPHNLLMSIISRIMRKLEDTSDNLKGILPEMMKEAGFNDVAQLNQFSTAFGTLSIYYGKKVAQ
jgi:ubiquinone/menaquinone biosynthesis C-methylase UbiE